VCTMIPSYDKRIDSYTVGQFVSSTEYTTRLRYNHLNVYGELGRFDISLTKIYKDSKRARKAKTALERIAAKFGQHLHIVVLWNGLTEAEDEYLSKIEYQRWLLRKACKKGRTNA